MLLYLKLLLVKMEILSGIGPTQSSQNGFENQTNEKNGSSNPKI